jgi:hypothetical protein
MGGEEQRVLWWDPEEGCLGGSAGARCHSRCGERLLRSVGLGGGRGIWAAKSIQAYSFKSEDVEREMRSEADLYRRGRLEGQSRKEASARKRAALAKNESKGVKFGEEARMSRVKKEAGNRART